MSEKQEYYIFLDIDGVLNTEADWKRAFTVNKKCLDVFREILEELGKKWTVKIVLSSTWRRGVTSTGIKGNYSMNELGGIEIFDITPITQNKTRQEEIEYYIRKHEVKYYIILDDDVTLFPQKEKIHLYVTNSRTGLTHKDAMLLKKG